MKPNDNERCGTMNDRGPMSLSCQELEEVSVSECVITSEDQVGQAKE